MRRNRLRLRWISPQEAPGRGEGLGQALRRRMVFPIWGCLFPLLLTGGCAPDFSTATLEAPMRLAYSNYRLDPGMLLRYTGSGSDELRGGYQVESTVRVDFYVLAGDDERTRWALAHVQRDAIIEGGRLARPHSFEQSGVVLFPFDDRGQLLAEPHRPEWITPEIDPSRLIVALPEPEEAAQTWEATGSDEERWRLRLTEKPSRGPLIALEGQGTLPHGDAFDASHTLAIDFDVSRGVVDRLHNQFSIEPRLGVERHQAQLQLQEIVRLPGDRAARLQNDLGPLLAAWCEAEASYRELSAAEDYAAAKASSERLFDELDRYRRRCRDPLVAEAIAQLRDDSQQDLEALWDGALIAAELREAGPTDWTVRDLEGQEHRLEQYAGRPLLLGFFFRDSVDSIRMLARLDQLQEQFAQRGVGFIAVSTNYEERLARQAAEILQLQMPVLYRSSLPESYMAYRLGFPTLLVLDGQGQVRYLHKGDRASLGASAAEQVEQLLAEESPAPQEPAAEPAPYPRRSPAAPVLTVSAEVDPS